MGALLQWVFQLPPLTLLWFALQRCLGVHKLHSFCVKLNWELCSRRLPNATRSPTDEWAVTPDWNILDIKPSKRCLG